MFMQLPQTSNVDKLFHQNYSSLRKKRSSNFSFLLLLLLSFESLISISTSWLSYSSIAQPFKPWQISLIGSEGISNILFIACYRAQEKNKAKTGVISNEASKVNANNNYICFISENSDLDIDGFSSKENKDNDYWEDVADGS